MYSEWSRLRIRWMSAAWELRVMLYQESSVFYWEHESTSNILSLPTWIFSRERVTWYSLRVGPLLASRSKRRPDITLLASVNRLWRNFAVSGGMAFQFSRRYGSQWNIIIHKYSKSSAKTFTIKKRQKRVEYGEGRKKEGKKLLRQRGVGIASFTKGFSCYLCIF